jgi:hypothetical protein
MPHSSQVPTGKSGDQYWQVVDLLGSHFDLAQGVWFLSDGLRDAILAAIGTHRPTSALREAQVRLSNEACHGRMSAIEADCDPALSFGARYSPAPCVLIADFASPKGRQQQQQGSEGEKKH